MQNFNFSIQRELSNNVILDVSYIGSKSTSLYSRLPLNTVRIGNNQFLEAFNVTRTGGDHPLFDKMLMGLNIPGAGVVNGRTVTGSSALRLYTNTRTLLANGSVGGLADFLNLRASGWPSHPAHRRRAADVLGRLDADDHRSRPAGGRNDPERAQYLGLDAGDRGWPGKAATNQPRAGRGRIAGSGEI